MIERLRLPHPRHALANGRAAWLAIGVLTADVLLSTSATDFPNGSGVRYWVVWLVAGAACLAVGSVAAARLRPASPRLRPLEGLAVLAVLTMLLTDVTMAWQPLRDLAIYLRAGRHFLDGAPVYSQAQLLVQPDDRTLYPFVYPPCTLPLFGALAMLPEIVVQAIWVGVSVALGLGALRLFGLPRRWLVLALAWPPLFEGLWVGNVAVPLLALFALGPWLGAGLPLGAVFKPTTGLTGLWLVRQRLWRQAAASIFAAAVVLAATLPLTGLSAWRDWLDGLAAYQASQAALPGLYGFGLMRFVPAPLFAAAALAAIAAAARARGLESLARFGTATVVASPTLFGHGLLLTVPSLLSLRAVWLWLAIGLLATPDGLQWWLAVAVVVASWAAPAMKRSIDEADPLHPLPAGSGPWPIRPTGL